MKVTMVTGASSGLGKSLAIQLAKQGNNLLLTGRSSARLQETVDACSGSQGSIRTKIIDFVDLENLSAWLDEIEAEGLEIDGFYHCAIFNVFAESFKLTAEQWDVAHKVNLLSPALLLSRILPGMVKRRSGQITLISSVTAFTGFGTVAPYVAAKKGIEILFRSLEPELARYGVQTHLAIPGKFESHLFERSPYYVSSQKEVSNFLKKHCFFSISAERSVQIILKSVAAKKRISYFPIYARPLCSFSQKFPTLPRLLNRNFVKEALKIKHFPKIERRTTSFQNQTILITGGASGIGRALTEQFLSLGAKVIALDFDESALDKLKSDCEQKERLETFKADITDFKRLTEIEQELRERSLTPQILINNAGVTRLGETQHQDFHQWKRLLDTNFLGTILTSLAFQPEMEKQGKGHLVNISSLSGIGGYATAATYAMSKGAINGLTISLIPELEAKGMKVSLVCPSYVHSGIFTHGNIPEALGKSGVEKSFLCSAMSPEQAAKHIVKGIAKGKRQIIFPFSGKLLNWLVCWVPGASRLLQKKLLKSFFSNLEL